MTTPPTYRATINVQVLCSKIIETQNTVLAAVAVKVVDAAKRAAEAALVLRFIALEGEPESVLTQYAQSTIEIWRGIRTSYIRAIAPT